MCPQRLQVQILAFSQTGEWTIKKNRDKDAKCIAWCVTQDQSLNFLVLSSIVLDSVLNG